MQNNKIQKMQDAKYRIRLPKDVRDHIQNNIILYVVCIILYMIQKMPKYKT